MPVKMEAYMTEDGDLWSVFVYGHAIDISAITLADINAGLDYMGHAPLDDMPAVERLWMHQIEDDTDYPWLWCNAADSGAIAVTGARFS